LKVALAFRPAFADLKVGSTPNLGHYQVDHGALTPRGGFSMMDADLAGAGSALRIIEIIGYDRMWHGAAAP